MLRSSQGKSIAALHCLLVLYSCSGILSKLAAGYPIMSLEFCVCYAGIIGLLGIYAICWQQIIKRIPLTTAYANRAVSVVWGMVWGVVVFAERLSLMQVVGGVVVLVGVVFFAYADEKGISSNGDKVGR